ncbi:hypothetical protein KI811_05885 [Geobacter hydrogenophilus]|uniref:Membrane protein n=1 Tax=Geobacter hydrogenophilus TaxID=40983 RepID=A0A9W6G1T2_9BACT|nr:hypothetical protein [Geobacter hydrogenophilus]MBT0893343.1 hypothetical protein [Geobacter hydrogenophilus]GLI38807.1 membrane protein [Geobacter hydrogenophilus]
MNNTTQKVIEQTVTKVPAVTLGFWVVKVAATTLGETGGDWVTMSLKLGYLVGAAIFAAIFITLVYGQIKAVCFHPFLYWPTIVATTTLGTTMADFFDRSVGVGYPGGASIISALLLTSLFLWYRVEGTVSIRSITTRRAEWFYWCTILFSQTLGTALGDWIAGSDRGGLGLGYEYSALIFGAALLVVAGIYFWTSISRTILFWVAFVLTRPLGATVGDFLDKPISQGGLHLNRLYASLVLLAFMATCILLIPQRPANTGRGD